MHPSNLSQANLAQVNLAIAVAPLSDPAMAAFVARIEEINRLAEHSPGFLWRYQGPSDLEALRPLAGYVEPLDPARLLFNMSVWRAPEDLRNYVYRTTHRELLRDKRRWFVPFDRAPLAMWWVPAAHRPTIAEAAERLRRLDAEGPTAFAFHFGRVATPGAGASR